MVTSHEQEIIDYTRERIDEYVSCMYFSGKVATCAEVEVLTTKPVDDPDIERMYEQADGDPVRYALKLLIDGVGTRLGRAVRSGAHEAANDARNELSELLSCEAQYVDPLKDPLTNT